MMEDGHTMQHGIGASTTGFLAVAIAAFCVASCSNAPRRPPPAQPPARALVVTDGRISLQATAWVELHSWLAGAARNGDELAPELEPTRRAYARSLQDDDEDLLLARTTRALSRCSDDRCANAAVAAEGFGRSYERALPFFVAQAWLSRAGPAWIGIEASHAALGAIGPAGDALCARAASDLGVTWPDHAVPVDVVSEAPPVGRAALVPVTLATRGRCFVPDRSSGNRPDERVDRARILDCVLVHALLAAQQEGRLHAGPIHAALVRDLGEHDGERAWSLLVIHSVAAIMTGWEPKHRSVYRRSAEAVERSMLEWLAAEWRGLRRDTRSSEDDPFTARYVARWREPRREAQDEVHPRASSGVSPAEATSSNRGRP
jgi:hypothetical protein